MGAFMKGLDRAGNSPLHWACRGGHVDTVKLLLSKKPAINAQNKLGDTPLHSAAWAGNAASVQLLLECSEIQPLLKNKNGETPLDLAKTDEVASLLMKATGRANVQGWTEDDDDD
jgi:ankyrin repeat protein